MSDNPHPNAGVHCWAFIHLVDKFSENSSEISFFRQFLTEELNAEIFKFYAATRRQIIRSKLGDKPSENIHLCKLVLNTEEWVGIASNAF